MKLSERLYTSRKQRKITLKEAAKKCGCSFQHLQKLEKEKIFRPKLELLYRLAVFYCIPPDMLILEAGKIPQDVYWKITRCPQLLQVIRDYPE